MSRLLPWIAAGVILGLAIYWATGREPSEADGLAEPGTCEARCIDRDPACAALFDGQGGFPAAELSPEQRASSCRGTCFVLRRTASEPSQPCLR